MHTSRTSAPAISLGVIAWAGYISSEDHSVHYPWMRQAKGYLNNGILDWSPSLSYITYQAYISATKYLPWNNRLQLWDDIGVITQCIIDRLIGCRLQLRHNSNNPFYYVTTKCSLSAVWKMEWHYHCSPQRTKANEISIMSVNHFSFQDLGSAWFLVNRNPALDEAHYWSRWMD